MTTEIVMWSKIAVCGGESQYKFTSLLAMQFPYNKDCKKNDRSLFS